MTSRILIAAAGEKFDDDGRAVDSGPRSAAKRGLLWKDDGERSGGE